MNAKGGHSAAFEELSTHDPIFIAKKVNGWGASLLQAKKTHKWPLLVQEGVQLPVVPMPPPSPPPAKQCQQA